MQTEAITAQCDDRLSFLKIFMAEHGITQKEVATLFDRSKCAVSHMFTAANDMRISEIEKIFESRGCYLKFSITRDPNENVDKYTLAQSDYLTTASSELVRPRLYFIMIAMKRYDVSRERLATLLGIKSSTIRYWLYVANDTYISKVMDVAKALGCHLKVQIVNTEQDKAAEELRQNPRADQCRMIVETNSVRVSKI